MTLLRRSTRVKWHGREVTRQPQRAALGVCLISLMLVTFPLHIVLAAFDGQGFVRADEDGTTTYDAPWWAVLVALAVICLLVGLIA